jgi:hypothetical protein
MSFFRILRAVRAAKYFAPALVFGYTTDLQFPKGKGKP